MHNIENLKENQNLLPPPEFESWEEELSPSEASPRPEDVYELLDDDYYR